jgi:hypothetical protein
MRKLKRREKAQGIHRIPLSEKKFHVIGISRGEKRRRALKTYFMKL